MVACVPLKREKEKEAIMGIRQNETEGRKELLALISLCRQQMGADTLCIHRMNCVVNTGEHY